MLGFRLHKKKIIPSHGELDRRTSRRKRHVHTQVHTTACYSNDPTEETYINQQTINYTGLVA
jgi:hypothetical protein